MLEFRGILILIPSIFGLFRIKTSYKMLELNLKILNFKFPTKSSYFSSDVITHSQMVNEIFEYTMIPARFIGAGIYDKNFQVLNKKLIFLLTLLTITMSINVYDIYYFRNDIVRCIFCLMTFSAGVQGYIKFYTFVILRKDLIELRNAAEKFHENFESPKSSKIFENKFMIATHVSATLTLLYVCTFILLSIYPILFYFITNERILHFGIELPFIDWKYSYVGYTINFVHQLYCALSFFCGSIPTLCIIICFMTSAIGQFDVLEILLDEINELSLVNEDRQNDNRIKMKIIFLIQTHTNLVDFLKKLKKTFSMYYFIEFAALIFQKTVILFAIISVSKRS